MDANNKGRAWVFGDNVDTDALAPGRFMHRPFEELAQNCLIDLSPEFAKSANEGDIIIAGRNFGVGSSRDQAAQALKARGLSAIVAKGFAGIFYRNAINFGLPVFIGDASVVPDGSPVSINIETGILTHDGGEIQLEPLPAFLMELIRNGGLVPHLEKRFAAEREKQ